MTKRKDTAQQRLLSAARRALAARHAQAPVPAYNGKVARIDAASKRARSAQAAPPPEQMARVPFIETDINEHALGYDDDGNPFVTKVRIGRAYQRQARFETIEGLSVAQIAALRRYRRAFDVSEISPMKSALDVGEGGGDGGAEAALSRLERRAFADHDLRRIERRISPDLLGVLRAVALEDLDFKTIALAQYGSTSGQRRAQVRSTFMLAVVQLGRAMRGSTVASPSDVGHPAVAPDDDRPDVDPAFLDERGYMRPYSEIADILCGKALANAPAETEEEHL